MDLDILRGVLLVALIIGFAAMVGWAWSKKRKPEFDQAARMPLEEDVPDEGSGSNNYAAEEPESGAR